MEPRKSASGHVPFAASLPLYLTRFIGHEQERATLGSLLQHKRLLTLVGPGGIGKTRLALQIAADVADAFSDGLVLIELASLSDSQLVLHTLATALHVRSNQDIPLLSLLIDALQDRQALLIFDNCEHVLTECASLFEALLHACPQVHLLVTSREPLDVAGEMVWRIAALSSPNPEQISDFAELEHYEAVQLFCERATESNPRFCLTPQNAPAIARLCYQLDGLPLSLELAAALLPVLSVEQLTDRFHEHLQLLKHGKRTAPSRQQTLEATFDWSYALLSPSEQALFQQLAVFTGSWNLESMEQICAPSLPNVPNIFPLLVRLVNASLVIAEEYEGQDEQRAEVRYRLLETIRQYALKKLEETEMWQEIYDAHTQWYLHMAEQTASRQESQQMAWFHRLELETANLRAVLVREMSAGNLARVARLTEALRRFWILHNNLSEGRYWFETLLAAEKERQQLEPLARARVLFGAAHLARYQGAIDRACALYEEQIALLKTLDAPAELSEARDYLGTALGMQGSYKQAIQMIQANLSFYRDIRDQQGIMRSLTTLAFFTLTQGDYPQAIALSDEVIRMQREAGNYLQLPNSLFILAQAALLQGEIEQARAACLEAFQLTRSQTYTYGLASSLGLIGALAGQEKLYEQAARLFGAAQALHDQAQAPHPPAGRALQERMILPVRSALGKDLFLKYHTEGMHSPIESILQEAENVATNAPASSGTSPITASLTPSLARLSPREREILILVATGLTDVQIAQSLNLSRRTVSKHVQSIYNKLTINSRSAATRLALENGLV